MAIANRTTGAFTQNAGSGDVASLPLPTGHASGDILIPVISEADNVRGTMSGYQELLYILNGANQALIAFWKQDNGSEAAPTYTHTGGNGAGGFVLGFSGMNTLRPFMPLYVAANKESGSGSTQTATAKAIDPAFTNSGVLFICGEAGAGTGGSGGNNYASWSGTNPTFTEVCDNMAFNGTREACIGGAWGLTSDGAATGDRTVSLSGLDPGAHTTISVMLELVDSSVVIAPPFNDPAYNTAWPKLEPAAA